MNNMKKENTDKSAEEMSIKEAMDQLEEILNAMENPQIPLEESFSLYQRGVDLVKICNGKLDGMEKKLIMIQEGQSDQAL